MPRGQKLCRCGHKNGPRAKSCSKCDVKFAFAAKKFSPNKVEKKSEDLDWKQLQKGDYIKSVAGYGPFYPTTDEVTEEFVAMPMGHYGVFVVAFVDENGIGAHEVLVDSNGGFCYLYMGEEKLSSVTETVLRPHKLYRITRRLRV